MFFHGGLFISLFCSPKKVLYGQPVKRQCKPQPELKPFQNKKLFIEISYQPCRQVQTVVSEAAMKAEPSQRIEVLANAKTYAPLKIKPNSEWDWSEWESDLTDAAKNASASDRVLVLSNPKQPHRNYQEGRPVIWEVSQSAQKALPSLRVQQLARPKSRSQYNEDYDANA